MQPVLKEIPANSRGGRHSELHYTPATHNHEVGSISAIGLMPGTLNAAGAPLPDYRLLRRLRYLTPAISPRGANISSPFIRPDAIDT